MNYEIPLIIYEMPTKKYWKSVYPDNGYQAKLAFKTAVKVYHRTVLSEAQNHKCCWCGRVITELRNRKNSATIEHVQPRSLGGPDHPDNYAVSCDRCNSKRGTIVADDYSNRQVLMKSQEDKDSIVSPTIDGKKIRKEVRDALSNGLPNSYEIGSKKYKLYERYKLKGIVS